MRPGLTFRIVFVGATVAGLALVLAPRDRDAPSLGDLATRLMQPAFPKPDAPEAAQAEPSVPAQPAVPAPRVQAAPPSATPEPSPAPAAVPRPDTRDPAPETAREVAIPADPKEAAESPALIPSSDGAPDVAASADETSEAAAGTPGDAEDGERRPDVILRGLDRARVRRLLMEDRAALVATLADGRQLRYRPGAGGELAHGAFAPWDGTAARAFSNWHWPLGRGAALDGVQAVPLRLLRARLARLDPLARLESLSLALGPALHAEIAAAQDAALSALGFDTGSPDGTARAIATEGCLDGGVRFDAVQVLDGPAPGRRLVPGARPCR